MKKLFDEVSEEIKNLDKKKPEPSNLVKEIDNYLTRVELKRESKLGFFVSQIPNMCLRKEVYRHLSQSVEVPVANTMMRKIFDAGHAIHSYWQNRYLGPSNVLYGTWKCVRCEGETYGHMPKDPCKQCGWHKPLKSNSKFKAGVAPCANTCIWKGGYNAYGRDCRMCKLGLGNYEYREPRLLYKIDGDPEMEIRGYCDGMAKIQENQYVLEMKSKGHSGFSKVRKPDKDHVEQCNLALGILKRNKIWGCKSGLVVYICKSTNNIKSFEVPFDEKMFEKSLDKVRKVVKAVRALRSNPELSSWSEEQFNVEIDKVLKGNKRPCGSPDCSNAKACLHADVCFAGIKFVSQEKFE